MLRLTLWVPLIAFVACQRYRSIYQSNYSPSAIIRPMGYVQRTVQRGVPIIRSSPRAAVLDATRPLPCCKDESGGSICRAMKSNDPRSFEQKCETEPDFSLVVCCKSCNEVAENYRIRASNFFSKQNNSTNCFNRMGEGYCSRFQNSADAWSNKRWSCHSEHYRLGFRVCRATCGFCSLDWKNAPNPKKCN